ncbi:MAG TPA: hypothetical protein VMH36_26545 [Alphaproteobacteria bacterium]|nr:hypothetical protein [Alphaproteobacteria bacterium]
MDIASYRLHERLASASLPTWRIKALQNPIVFQAGGFPVRIESTDELVALLDTMQENRFGQYIKELGGLDEEDLAVLVDALVEYCKFFRTNFSGRDAPLPLSTMVAHLAIAKKLRALGRPHRILEIGPGCGYLSFFLKGWSDLEDYTQVETTESFYVLQNLVNKHVFGHRFRDHAQTDLEGRAALPITAQIGIPDTEISPRIPLDMRGVCRHFPWWQLGRVATERFSVVTTNATLTEFSEGALRQYVWLIDQCLAPDGCLVVQCCGGGSGSLETILQLLFSIRLAPVALVLQENVTIGDKYLAKTNLLFVRERHPLFAKYAKPKLTLPLFDPNDLLVRAVYGIGGGGSRREVTADELVTRVTERLARV